MKRTLKRVKQGLEIVNREGFKHVASKGSDYGTGRNNQRRVGVDGLVVPAASFLWRCCVRLSTTVRPRRALVSDTAS